MLECSIEIHLLQLEIYQNKRKLKKMGKYFNVEELSRSSRASKAGIDNTPSKEIEKHLEELIEVLDQIREE